MKIIAGGIGAATVAIQMITRHGAGIETIAIITTLAAVIVDMMTTRTMVLATVEMIEERGITGGVPLRNTDVIKRDRRTLTHEVVAANSKTETLEAKKP